MIFTINDYTCNDKFLGMINKHLRVNKIFKTFTTFLGEVPILTHIEKKRLKFKQEMEAKQELRKKTIDI